MANVSTTLRVAKKFAAEVLVIIAKVCFRTVFPARKRPVPDAGWWQKPGLGVQYQIEYRPGYDWQRDWVEFNRGMSDAKGAIRFNGPFPRIAEWVKLSQETGLDYHSMEIKWHDGICYFDTKLTDWKTKVDYAARFARESRKAKIPFLFYYSTVFDHNPAFDSIQPKPRDTQSYLTLGPQPAYEKYITGHFGEIMERYEPDGIWLDWYWPDRATKLTIEFFRRHYPKTVLAFNFANYFPRSYRKLDFTSGEAHDLEGPYIKLIRSAGQTFPVWSSAWKWSTLYRRLQSRSSEIISPAGKWWSDPALRDDPYILLRMSAIVMASGMRHCYGVTSRMDGSLVPDQARQLRLAGSWYAPRKKLFTESLPLRYRGREPRSIATDNPGHTRVIACSHEGDVLVHLVNMHGSRKPLKVWFKGRRWKGVRRVTVEPSGRELPIEKNGNRFSVKTGREIDPVDTILRLWRGTRDRVDRVGDHGERA